MIDVPVLITSCKVSQYWKMGPVAAQKVAPARAQKMNARGRLMAREIPFAIRSNIVDNYPT